MHSQCRRRWRRLRSIGRLMELVVDSLFKVCVCVAVDGRSGPFRDLLSCWRPRTRTQRDSPIHEISTRIHRDGRLVKVTRSGFLVLIPEVHDEDVPSENSYPSVCQDALEITSILSVNQATVPVSVHELFD